MDKRILAEMEFASIISEATAQTQTGAELINRYKSHLMANESTCALVNNFIKEAQQCRYDNGVNHVLETVSDYIMQNKITWALTTACESIRNNSSRYNYLNLNATKQVEKLLEMEEEDVVKYIKAGALKNVMYCESFRNIVKQVYKDQPIVETTADYTKVTPVSLVENVGDGICFSVCGSLYKINDDKTVQEAQSNEVSNTFKVVNSLLESNYVNIDNFTITVNTHNASYEISEACKVIRKGNEGETEMTVEQLRDNNRLVLMTTNPRYRNQMAGLLESIALLCENYDHVLSMDNVSIYTTKNDKFLVIESDSNVYSTLIASNRSSKWTINENVVDALTFIKKKTNASISEEYKEIVENYIGKVSEEEQGKIQEEIKENQILSLKERIEKLTEKYKNDPVKLAILSKCAQTLNEE